MKKMLIAMVVCLFVLGINATANAVVLIPNTSVATTGASVPAGTFVTSITTAFAASSGAWSGSVTENVYLNATGYLFVYQWSNDPGSLDAIARMTASNYTGFLTDADAVATGLQDEPHFMSRSAGGNSIGFAHSQGTTDQGVLPGTTTAQEWIQTNAQYYGPGFVDFIDGGVAEIKLFGPAVPEPASASLLGLGLLGFVGALRRKFIA